MAVTIRDVARRAGVGIGTVSSVVNNSRPVSEPTRQKVLAAIEELNFVPNPSGRRLSLGKAQTIAILIPFFTHISQFERLRGVMSVIPAGDYDVSLLGIETTSQLNQVLHTVSHQGRIDGLLIFAIVPTATNINRLRKRRIPTVLVGGHHPELHSITLDELAASRNAVQHLIDLGHRKIAYINEYIEDSNLGNQRYQGYCQALEMAHLPYNEAYYCHSLPGSAQSRQTIQKLLQLSDPPTAILTYSDKLALDVLQVARDLKLDVPGDLSLISYEDSELAQLAQLTAVRQRLFESGIQSIELLLNLLDKPESLPVCFQLPIELVIRQTTAPVYQ